MTTLSNLLTQKNDEEKIPLLIAAEAGHLQIFQFLLNNGSAIGHVDVKGNHACHWAALNGHLDIVEFVARTHPNLLLQKNYAGDLPLLVGVKYDQ